MFCEGAMQAEGNDGEMLGGSRSPGVWLVWGECGSCSGAGGKGGRRGKSSCLTRRLKVELIGFATVGERARGSGMTQDLPPEPHRVNGVTVSKMGKMEGEQVWE